MIDDIARRQEVLAHIGGALLSAQLVEHFIALFLSPAAARDADMSGLSAFLAAPRSKRRKRLRDCLAKLKGHKIKLTLLERNLNSFLIDRNKLVHCFHEMGSWNFEKGKDCYECVSFLRGFIDRAAALQNEFVSVLSVRDIQFKTRVSASQSKAYKKNYRRVHGPLNVRWFSRHDA